MGWIKAAWIPPMFAAFNQIAPNRSKASDGTIGDTAHQSSASGHNPDDTPGSRAEREDSDSIAEVRAADVTTALNSATTMEMVIQSILATPAERNRLIYIIFNRRIWRKSNGWQKETYTGSDPHDTHAHLSGDPASDADAGAWNSVLNVGGNMAEGYGYPDAGMPVAQAYRVLALAEGTDAVRGGPYAGESVWLVGAIKRLEAKLDQTVTAMAASAVREIATSAAVNAMAAQISSAGGDVDVAAINSHIDTKVAEVTGTIENLQAQLAASEARERALEQRLRDAHTEPATP